MEKIRENIEPIFKVDIDSDSYTESTINIADEREFDLEKSKMERIYIKKNKHLPIDDLLDFILSAKKSGASHLDFYGHCEIDYDIPSFESLDITPFKERDETAEEFKLRTEKQQRLRIAEDNARKEKELEQYNKLKAKYGN